MLLSPRSIFLTDAVSVALSRVAAACAVAVALVVLLSAHPAAAQATVEYGHVASGSGSALTGLSNKLNSALPSENKPSYVVVPNNQPGLMAVTEDNLEAANRLALQRRAGQDAAKLSLKSVPGKAVVRIDGKPVGVTPLVMSLAPGTYQIAMEGPRMESGKQQLTLGAKETHAVELRLSAAPRYPSSIRLQ
jgi:PEGA domain